MKRPNDKDRLHMEKVMQEKSEARGVHHNIPVCEAFGCNTELSLIDQLAGKKCTPCRTKLLTHTMLVKNYFLTIKIKV